MLKQDLLIKNIAEDNAYLDKYVQLMSSQTNSNTFEKHHIIPVSYYKLNNLTVDNTSTNIVKLSVHDHILAHYYACLCFKEPLKSKMIHAFCLMSKENVSFLNEEEHYIIEKLTHISELRQEHNRLLSERVFSAETLEKMRPSWFKKGNVPYTKGRPCPNHVKEKLRQYNLEHPSQLTEEGRKRIVEANSYPRSDKTKQKMQQYSKNRTEKHLKNLSLAATGKTHANDGVKNRWWKKSDPLPDGWSWGWL